MRTLLATAIACSAVAAAERDRIADLRVGLGVAPSFEFSGARDVRGASAFAIGFVYADLDMIRPGGPGGVLLGIELVSSSADRESGLHEELSASAIALQIGWAVRLPSRARPWVIEAAAFSGSGDIELERDGGSDVDDSYRCGGARLAAMWHDETRGWSIGLEGRFLYGVADFDDIDDAGTDSRMRQRGATAMIVFGRSF